MSHFTVVFNVENKEEFQKLLGPLMESMGSGEPYMGAVVTGAGKGDSMTQEELLMARLDEHHVDYSDIAR